MSTVQLKYGEALRYPGGSHAVFNTYEEAEAQALSDMERGRDPGPEQITNSETGEVLADKPKLLELAAKAKAATAAG